MKQSQLLKVQVNGEVKVLAVAIIKKVNKNAYITFDFEKFGAVKIIQKSKVGESFDKTLAVISCNEIKQVSYTLYDVVSDNLQKFAKATHDLSFEL